MVYVRHLRRAERVAASICRRSNFHSIALGTATPSTPSTPRTVMDAWNIKIDEVEDYEIVQDGNNHITWRSA